MREIKIWVKILERESERERESWDKYIRDRERERKRERERERDIWDKYMREREREIERKIVVHEGSGNISSWSNLSASNAYIYYRKFTNMSRINTSLLYTSIYQERRFFSEGCFILLW